MRQKLIDIIEKVWCCKYIGPLEVTETSKGFLVKIGIPDVNKPTVIAADLSEEKFLKFFTDQIREMNVDGFYKYEVNRRIADDEECLKNYI